MKASWIIPKIVGIILLGFATFLILFVGLWRCLVISIVDLSNLFQNEFSALEFLKSILKIILGLPVSIFSGIFIGIFGMAFVLSKTK